MKSRLQALRQKMQESGLKAYVVPTADYHGSEYVGAFFKAREYLSGFSGSAGTLVVLLEKAALFTDGRYFLQAEQELGGTQIELMKTGLPGVPSWVEYLCINVPSGAVVGFDGRVLDTKAALELEEKLKSIGAGISFTQDLVADVWENRPPMKNTPVHEHDICYAGKSVKDKLAQLRGEMKKHGADVHIITALDEIAWLFNLRASDVEYNPVALSYAVIEDEKAYLFLNEASVEQQLKTMLSMLNVELRPYEGIYSFVERYTQENHVLLSSGRINYLLYSLLANRAQVVDAESPVMLAKAIKNPVEREGMRIAHKKDGVALVKFLHWLKTKALDENATEKSAANVINELRLEQPGCMGPSFSTISAFGEHSAVVHYSVSEQTDKKLKKGSFYLVDSGGQYLEGTTDATRTVAMGELTKEQRRHYTLVLRGMLELAHMQFLSGCRGDQLDLIARAPLWRAGLDYRHGTGHGIGSMLCVHEPPVSIRWQPTKECGQRAIVPGMVVSDEPGLYFAGEYGIRLENQMLCVEKEENDFGEFFGFEMLTLAPFDISAIEVELLTYENRAWLNAYHMRVREELSPSLTKEEREWLELATREI